MKRFIVWFLPVVSVLIAINCLRAQETNDDILMTIAGKNVTVGEFLSIYQKNNIKNQPIDQESLNEYLELFINFKLKVREAEDLGLDTLSSFKTELGGYREQLAKPYFTDDATLDQLVREAYERSRWDIRASHIFVKVRPDALPADTLIAWKKIRDYREKLRNGESFEKIAVEFSEDPSARDREAGPQNPFIKGNKGDMGFFTVFDMLYPFESAAFNTEVGQVSDVIHTDYGYHLIKVTEKHPALGKFQVAHIYMTIPRGATAEDSARVRQHINKAYSLLKDGAKWDSVVKAFSEDKASAARGGVLNRLPINRLVPEFVEALYQLDNVNDFSKPILTSYGWHIIKLVEKESPASFEVVKADLKQKVMKDSRSKLSHDVILEQIKKEYNLQQFTAAKEDFYRVVTDSIFFGKWNVKEANGLNKPLFQIGDQITTQQDFAVWLASKQKKKERENIRYYVGRMYTDFLNEKLMQYEDKNLERKHPEFQALMKEYRDGILLFDLTDRNVWSKAVKDTLGLKEFYEKNKNNYMWEERIDASIYTVKDPSAVAKVRNFIATGLNDDAILKEINHPDTVNILAIESGKFSRKDNPFVDKSTWAVGLNKEINTDDGIVFLNIRQILKPEVKQLSEARGLITADFQNYLEKEWIKELKKKYPVKVHEDILRKIK